MTNRIFFLCIFFILISFSLISFEIYDGFDPYEPAFNSTESTLENPTDISRWYDSASKKATAQIKWKDLRIAASSHFLIDTLYRCQTSEAAVSEIDTMMSDLAGCINSLDSWPADINLIIITKMPLNEWYWAVNKDKAKRFTVEGNKIVLRPYNTYWEDARPYDTYWEDARPYRAYGKYAPFSCNELDGYIDNYNRHGFGTVN